MKIEKEKIITVAAIAAGVGALLVLQKFTTPHRRQRPPSASHVVGSPREPHLPIAPGQQPPVVGAGGPLAAGRDARRSASRGGSRPRTGVNGSVPRSRSHSQPNPPLAVPGDERRARKSSRAPSNAAPPPPLSGTARRDHPHPRSHSLPHHNHNGAAAAAVAPHEQKHAADGCPTASVPLTVKSLSDHYRKEGALSSVKERLSSPDPDAHREFPASNSPPRLARPSQRSPSNVATVGSKSMEGDGAMLAAVLSASVPTAVVDGERGDRVGDGSTEQASRTTVPPPLPQQQQQTPKTARNKRPHHHEKGTAAPKTDEAAQTDAKWFSEDRGTQTELPSSLLTDLLTPAKVGGGVGQGNAQMTAGPVRTNAGEDSSELALSPIDHQDPGNGLDSSSPTPLRKAGEAAAMRGGDGVPKNEPSDEDDRSFIPRYLLLDAERQLNAVISSAYTTAPHNATSWMVLYCYLKELPTRVLTLLHDRKRLAPLPSPDVDVPSVDHGAVEGQGDLEGEVRDLLALVESAVGNSSYYFKWKGSKIVRRDGDYREALVKKLAENEAKKHRAGSASQRFAHMLIQDEDEGTATLGRIDADRKVLTDGHTAARKDGEEESSDADKLAVVVKRYAFVLMQGASTQTEGTTSGNDAVNRTHAYSQDYRTPDNNSDAHQNSHDDHLRGGGAGEVALLQNEQVQQLLRKLVAMKSTPEFGALRYGQQNSLFTCDFIEASAEAQRLLDHLATPEDAQRQPPTTHKALPRAPQLSPDQAAPHRPFQLAGDGTQTSLSPRSSPSKPSKPSIQSAAFRRGTSSTSALGLLSSKTLEPAATSSRSNGENAGSTSGNPNVFERLYTPPTRTVAP